MAWQKICVLCQTVPDLGSTTAPKEGEAFMAVQTEIAPYMIKTIGTELGGYTRLVCAIRPDTKPMLLPKEMYDGPLPAKPATPITPSSIPLQLLTAFLAGANQPDCPTYEDSIFALEYRDNVIGTTVGKLIEPVVRRNWYDRICARRQNGYSPPSLRLLADPSLIYHLGQQRTKLWDYIKYEAQLIDEGETKGFEPGSNFAILLITPHPLAIEQIWHTLAGEKQVFPGGAMLYTYHRKVFGEESFMYLHQATRIYPPSLGVRPVIVGFEAPPLLR